VQTVLKIQFLKVILLSKFKILFFRTTKITQSCTTCDSVICTRRLSVELRSLNVSLYNNYIRLRNSPKELFLQ